MHYLVPDVTAVDLADYTGAPKTLDLQSFERQRQNGHCRYERFMAKKDDRPLAGLRLSNEVHSFGKSSSRS